MKNLSQIAEEYGITVHDGVPSLPDWNLVMQVSEFQRLSTRNTTTRWHQEQNMMLHTKMVCSQMQRIVAEYQYTDDMAIIEMLAALFHDVGKCDCPNTDNGKLASDGHPLLSEKICRKILWDLNVVDRERICELVRLHDLHCQTSISDRKLVQKINNFSEWLFYNPQMLYNLFKADDLGGIKELSMYGSGAKMSNRIDYLIMESDYHFHQMTLSPDNFGHFTIYMMCGLPGSGKSTWAQNNHPDIPVISRDIIREELGLTPTGVKFMGSPEQEEEVSRISDERVENFCKTGQSFIYDNMNSREKYRRSLLNKISKYHPKVHIVYLEVKDLDVLRSRRPEIAKVGPSVFETMVDKMEFPRPDEYDLLTILENHSVGSDTTVEMTGQLHTQAKEIKNSSTRQSI